MRARSRLGRIALAILMLWLQLGSLGIRPAAAQASGKPPVARGEEYYEQSRFDEAIGLLRDLVDRGALAGEDLQKAREILARSYVKKGYPAQAKEMFKAILKVNPEYRPDPIRVPPDETAVFEQALKEYKSEAGTVTTPAHADTIRAAPTPPTTPGSPEGVVIPAEKSSSKEKKPLYKQWWVWLAGAAVIGGVAAAAGGGGGGGGTPDLANFPPPPP